MGGGIDFQLMTRQLMRRFLSQIRTLLGLQADSSKIGPIVQFKVIFLRRLSYLFRPHRNSLIQRDKKRMYCKMKINGRNVCEVVF
jgi:hypothetical protein